MVIFIPLNIIAFPANQTAKSHVPRRTPSLLRRCFLERPPPNSGRPFLHSPSCIYSCVRRYWGSFPRVCPGGRRRNGGCSFPWWQSSAKCILRGTHSVSRDFAPGWCPPSTLARKRPKERFGFALSRRWFLEEGQKENKEGEERADVMSREISREL